MTMSPQVLSTIACSSAPSAAGTLNLSSVVEVVHEGVPFLRRYVEMAVGVGYGAARVFCVPPLASQTISVTRYL
jgi:hypothetical protein